MALAFWICLAAIVYPYLIYPALLVAFNRLSGRGAHVAAPGYLPSVTILMPVHNEAKRVPAKIANLLALQYPADQVQIIAIADGCNDDSAAKAREAGGDRLEVIELPTWSGKAAALNAGLARATGDIVVFTDVGIMLEPGSLAALTAHFADPAIGCVSGEDYIAGADSEGLYGRIELLLRREEAKLHSIAGASGCFYGQRRELCKPFIAGMAHDRSKLEIVRAILLLAHSLKMDVVAEGVETFEQLVQLRALDCEYAQGYLFARPLDAESAEKLLAENRTW